MNSRLKSFIPVLLLVIVLVVLSAGAKIREKPSFLGAVLSTLVAPFEQAVTFSAQKVEHFWFSYFNLLKTKEQNEDMAKLIDRQKKQIVGLMEEHQANLRLTKLLNLLQDHPELETVTARIVAWDPGPWFNSFVISGGSRQKIGQDQAVIHDSGVVGRVVRVAPFYANVLLLTDYTSSIDVVVQRSRARGLASGQGPKPCSLKYVNRESDVRVGDLVLSSGLDGLFPAGIPVGTISKADRTSANKFWEIEVTPAVDFSALEEVLVVTVPPAPPQDWPDKELHGPWPELIREPAAAGALD